MQKLFYFLDLFLTIVSKWPSDVQQWPVGPDQAGEACEGPSDQRAAKRSARRRREAQKNNLQQPQFYALLEKLF